MNYRSHKGSAERCMREAVDRALGDAAMVWHGDAIRVTPVDTGLLRASLAWAVSGTRQHHGEAAGSDGRISVSSYQAWAPTGSARLGTNVAYAVAVHENLYARHKGGQIAKFIETPLRQNRRKYEDLIARTIRRWMA